MASPSRPVHALFWILCLGVALVSWRFLALGVEVSMPVMVHHLEARALALYAHIGLAPVALALIPLQLAPGLRARRPGLHRVAGRVYGLAVLVSGIGGLVIATGANGGPVAQIGFGLLGLLWLAITIRAVLLARAGRITAHRAWMVRSAALTFAAVTLRVYLPIGTALAEFEPAYRVIAWACWVPNLALAEWWLRRGRPSPARAQAS